MRDIVLTAADVTVVRGNWARISSTSGAGGQLMSSTDSGFTHISYRRGARQPLRVPFMAAANTNYHVKWMRAPSSSEYTI